MRFRTLFLLLSLACLAACGGDSDPAPPGMTDDGGGGAVDTGMGGPAPEMADCATTPAAIDIGGGDRGYGHICFDPADGSCAMFRSDETFPPCSAMGTLFIEAGGGTPGSSEDTYRYMRSYGRYWYFDGSSHGEITNEEPSPTAANRLNNWPGGTDITVMVTSENGAGSSYELGFRLDGRTWTLLSFDPR